MWNTIGFPIAQILDDVEFAGLENIIIACCYFFISLLLFADFCHHRKIIINWLTILIASLFLIGSGSYIFSKLIIATESKLFVNDITGNWVGLLPAIAFFIIYQRYQLLLHATPPNESIQELEERLRETAEKLEDAQANLEKVYSHLTQVERLTILGQLVSGVTHEINNPINFIYGNLPYLEEYTEGLLKVIDVYQQTYPANLEIKQLMEEVDLDYLRSDFPYIIESIKVGADRIRELVQNLRNFYRSDESQMKGADINLGIESSLLLLYNHYKNKIQIIKELNELPLVECYVTQINQVLLTVMGKAISTLLETENSYQASNTKQIVIHSKKTSNDFVIIQIYMNTEIRETIFEPIFDFKSIGIGTGLGLSIAHQIITEVHQGNLYYQSKLGEGTTFTIKLPINQVSKSQV